MGKNPRRKHLEGVAGAFGSDAVSRSEARRQQGPSAHPQDGRGFFARYRNLLAGVLVVLGIGIVGFAVFSQATASAYTCDTLLEAPENQTLPPLAGETEPRLGFGVEDEGTTHSERPTSYPSCPPTSGDHRAGGALGRDFYGPGSIQVPNDWVHNLEHGYAVIAYQGEPDRDVLDQIRGAMDAAEPTEVAISCGLPNKVIALRFDQMSQPFAVLAWDRALLMDSFDPELVTTAAAQFQDGPQAPERAC